MSNEQETDPDFGSDLMCFDDIDEAGRMVSGVDIIKQDAYHRLTTRALIDDPDWGIDVRDYLGKGYTAETIKNLQPYFDTVIQRDLRVKTSKTTLTLENDADPNGGILKVRIEADTDVGPFELVFSATALTTKVLEDAQ